MADIKKFQFILDGKIANNFKSELNKIGGTISGLNDTQVVVTFDENTTMSNFRKLYQKLEKENSDLTVQFRYDINKMMLQQAKKELSDMEVYIDADKANKGILELVKNLKDINLKLEVEGISESDEDELFKQGEKIADKIGKIISTHISIEGSTKMFDDLSDEAKTIIETFTNLNKIKEIKPFDIKNIEKQRKEVENITSIMANLEGKGAVASGKGGNVDDAQIKELRAEISEVKEDITSLKDRVDTLEDTTAFDNLSSQVEAFDERIKNTNDTLLNLKKNIKELTGQKALGQVLTDMSKHGRTLEDSGELLAYSSSSTGYTSDISESDSATGITNEFRNEVYKRIKAEAEDIDTEIHSHPDNEIVAASYDDIGVMIRHLEDGITKQVVTSLSQVMTFDFNSTNLSKDELKTKLLNIFEDYKKWMFKYFSPTDEEGNFHELAPFTDEIENKIVEYAKELLKIFPNIDEGQLDSDVTQRLFQDKIKELFSKQGLGDVVKLSNLVDIESSFSFSDIRKVADSAFLALTSQVKKAVEEGYAEGQDSHSPSKEAKKLNDDFVAGIEESAKKNAGKLTNIGKQQAEKVKDGFKEGMSDEVDVTTTLSKENQSSVLSGTNTGLEDKLSIIKEIAQAYENVVSIEDKMNETNEGTKKYEKLESDLGSAESAVRDFESSYSRVLVQLTDGSKVDIPLDEEFSETIGNILSDMSKITDITLVSPELQKAIDGYEILGKVLDRNIAKSGNKAGTIKPGDVLESTRAFNELESCTQEIARIERAIESVKAQDPDGMFGDLSKIEKAENLLAVLRRRVEEISRENAFSDLTEGMFEDVDWDKFQPEFDKMFEAVRTGAISAEDAVESLIKTANQLANPEVNQKDILSGNDSQIDSKIAQVENLNNVVKELITNAGDYKEGEIVGWEDGEKLLAIAKELDNYDVLKSLGLSEGSIEDEVGRLTLIIDRIKYQYGEFVDAWNSQDDDGISSWNDAIRSNLVILTEYVDGLVVSYRNLSQAMPNTSGNQGGISSDDLQTKSLKELVQLYHELGTFNGSDEELDKIADAILNIVQAEKKLDAGEMQKFVTVLKGLTFVDGDSPIIKTPYSIDEALSLLSKLSDNQTEVLSSADATAIESQDKLESKVEETTNALQEQEKVVKRFLYHWGNFNSGKVGESFNEMITSYFNGLNDKNAQSPYGAFGTGIYSISNPEKFTSIDTSTEDPLRKFMAIDVSNLKMYETKSEEHATALFNFLTKLQQMCINLATGFDYEGKFDASTVSIDGMYQEAKSLFANMDMTYGQYVEFINHMQELVKKSGLGAGNVVRPNGEGKDNIATKFMRALGYQGIDNTGTSYDSFTHGSVIFDKPDLSMVTKWDTASEVIEHYNQNVKTAVQLTEQVNQTPLSLYEDSDGQLSFIEQTKKTVDLIEEESGQMSMFENVAEKTTDSAIEGQMTLNDYLNKNIEGQMTLNNLVSNGSLTDIKGLKHYTDTIFDSFDSKMFGSGIGENRLGNAAYLFDEKNMSDWTDIGEYSKYLTTWSANQVKLFDQTIGFTESEIEYIIKNFYADLDEDMQSDYKFSFDNIFKDMDLYDFNSVFNINLEDVMKSLGYDAIKSSSGEYAFYNTDKLVREVQVYDNEANKIIEANNKVAQSIKETSDLSSNEDFNDNNTTTSLNIDKEKENLKELGSAIDDVSEKVQNKTNKFIEEGNVVSKVVSGEINYFNSLIERLKKTYIYLHKLSQYSGIDLSKISVPIQNPQIASGATNISDNPKEAVKRKARTVLKADEGLTPEQIQERTRAVTEATENLENSLRESGSFIKEITTFYDSQENLVKTILKEQKEIDGALVSSAWTTNYNFKDGSSFSSHIDSAKFKKENIFNTEEVGEYMLSLKDYFSLLETSLGKIESVSQGKEKGSAIATFIKDLGTESQITKVTIDDMLDAIEKLKDGTFDFDDYSSTTNFKKNKQKKVSSDTSSKKKQKKEIDEITEAYEQLIKKEEKHDILYAKSQISPNFMSKSEIKELEKYEEIERKCRDIIDNLDVSSLNEAQLKAREKYINERSRVLGLSDSYEEKLSTEHNEKIIESYDKLYGKIKEFSKIMMLNTEPDVKQMQVFEEIIEDLNKAINLTDEFSIAMLGSEESIEKVKNKSNELGQDIKKNFGITIENYITKMKKKIDRSQSGSQNTNFNPVYQDSLNTLKNLVDNLKQYKQIDINTEEGRNQLELLKKDILEIDRLFEYTKNNNQNDLFTMPEVSDVNKYRRELERILQENTKMPKKLRSEYEMLKVSFDNAFDSQNNIKITNEEFNKLVNTLSELNLKLEASGKKGKSFFSQVSQRLTDMNSKFIAQYFSFQDILRYIRQGFDIVKEYNSALIEMNKVSNENIYTLKEFQSESFNLAKSIGTTASQIQSSAADFMRLGYNLKDASELAQDANIYANVGDMGIDEATEHMISSIKAWGSEFESEVEASEAIIDRYNEIGKIMPPYVVIHR